MAPGRYVSLVVLLALLLVLGSTFYQFVAPFLLPLFLASVLAIVCQPLHRWVLGRCGGRTAVAAGVTTGALVAVVLVPVLVGTVLAALQLVDFTNAYFSAAAVQRTGQAPAESPTEAPADGSAEASPSPEVARANTQRDIWRDVVTPVLDAIPGYDEARLRAELEANANQLAKQLAGTTLSLASSTVGALISLTVALGIFLIALYYFLADGPELLAAAERLLPLPAAHQRKLVAEFAKATRAVVLATFCAAFAQGVATALALEVLGFGHFLVFLLAATATALIPVAGTWMVWGPCAVWLAVQGHWASAIGLTLWGAVFVSLLDNVVRTYVLNSDAQLHPLLAFISVIGALQVLGLWGIFIGPIVACCLSALAQIFNQELNEVLQERAPTPPPATPAPTPAVAPLPETISPVVVPASPPPTATPKIP
jgi:predicted PurR-regulated permease PerM